MSRPVLLLHGIWMHAIFLGVLKRKLAQQGLEIIAFSYPSMWQTLTQNADALKQFLENRGIESCDFIGHSLGGLVIREFLNNYREFPPCRVVALGTPFHGSTVAQRLNRRSIFRWMIGAKADSALIDGVSAWPQKHELGVIAGSLPLGAGQLVKRLREPNDGTVMVEETRINGMKAHEVIRVSHFGMLYSPCIATMSGCFIRNGCFEIKLD